MDKSKIKPNIIAGFRVMFSEIVESCRNESSKEIQLDKLLDALAEDRWDTYHRPTLPIDARYALQRDEMRYLHHRGWKLLAGTRDKRFCCTPEDKDFSFPMTLDQAVAEQKLRENPEPNGYYFYIEDSSKNDKKFFKIQSNIGIVKKEFWDQNHYMQDKYLKISHLLPDQVSEEGESLFGSTLPVEATRKLLLQYGFQENEAFTNFFKTHSLTNEVDREDDE